MWRVLAIITNDIWLSRVDDEALKLTKYPEMHQINRPFSDDLVQASYDIGVKILEIALDISSNNEHMCLAGQYFHPLFSQDDRTVDIGFDLDAYMDWYFNGTTHEERLKSAGDLMAGLAKP